VSWNATAIFFDVCATTVVDDPTSFFVPPPRTYGICATDGLDTVSSVTE
jgi:hypothetical protein